MKPEPASFIILTPGFPENESDSSCLPLQQSFARELHNQIPELEIHILSFQYPYNEEKYQWNGMNVKSFGGRNKGGIPKLLLRRKIFQELSRLHTTTNIRGIFSFWLGECAWVGNRFAKRNKLRHLCWILGQDARKENKYPGLIRPSPFELVALSDFIAEEISNNHGIKPALTGYPGLSPSLYPASGNKRDLDLLGVGSLIPLKRFEIFVEVAGSLVEKYPGIKGIIIGDGPEKKRLEALVSENGLRDNLSFAGQKDQDEVIRLMKRSRLLLHPSAYEGFGMVCLEALASGMQVISFAKPLIDPPSKWHYVNSKMEMLEKAIEILREESPDYSPVIPFAISETVSRIMDAFAYSAVKA